MSGMETQSQPIHWDRHRSSFNLTLIFALIVIVLGIIQVTQGGQGILLVVLGIGFAVYSWVTTPREYLIYQDALVIRYGTPRVKPIPFAEISNLESLALPMGERLRVRLASGRRLMLMAKDPETFRDKLDEAVNRYNSSQPGYGYVEGTVVDQGGPADFYPGAPEPGDTDVIEGRPPQMDEVPSSSSPTLNLDDLSAADPPFDSEGGLSRGPTTQGETEEKPPTPY